MQQSLCACRKEDQSVSGLQNVAQGLASTSSDTGQCCAYFGAAAQAHQASTKGHLPACACSLATCEGSQMKRDTWESEIM